MIDTPVLCGTSGPCCSYEGNALFKNALLDSLWVSPSFLLKETWHKSTRVVGHVQTAADPRRTTLSHVSTVSFLNPREMKIVVYFNTRGDVYFCNKVAKAETDFPVVPWFPAAWRQVSMWLRIKCCLFCKYSSTSWLQETELKCRPFSLWSFVFLLFERPDQCFCVSPHLLYIFPASVIVIWGLE